MRFLRKKIGRERVKEIQKLTSRALRQSELKNCGLCLVYMRAGDILMGGDMVTELPE